MYRLHAIPVPFHIRSSSQRCKIYRQSQFLCKISPVGLGNARSVITRNVCDVNVSFGDTSPAIVLQLMWQEYPVKRLRRWSLPK